MSILLFNVGVPMIFSSLPMMIIALLPIILLESFSFYSALEINFWRAFTIETVVNLISTFIGIPIAWLLLVGLQLITGGGSAYGINTFPKQILAVTWQSPWLVPYQNHLRWMIPVARMVLLIPFFFASWFCEYLVIKYLFDDMNNNGLNYIVRNANLLSYGLLGLCLLGQHLAFLLKLNQDYQNQL